MDRLLNLIFRSAYDAPPPQKFRVIPWGDAFAVLRGSHIETDGLCYQSAVELACRLNRGN